uniref:Acyltransferase 3 domain-containing protein n=1 Tax=Stomoxys calcitrans TaxID=35570 RepID=A0A1I8Q0X8_STOCA
MACCLQDENIFTCCFCCYSFWLCLLEQMYSSIWLFSLGAEFIQLHALGATYLQTPPLYTADNYHQCVVHQRATYCMVYVEIQPDNGSEIWQKIKGNHSSTKFSYRHDQVYRGICAINIKNHSSQTLNTSPTNAHSKNPHSDNVHMAKELWKISRRQKSIGLYEQQLHEHINEEMQMKYNLSAKTFVTYCENPKEPLNKEPSYYYAISLLIAIGILNILSTIFDAYFKMQYTKNRSNIEYGYYDVAHKFPVRKYLTTFSLYRNFRRLIAPNNSTLGKDLSFMDGFRSILSFVIVFEHMNLIQFLPLHNPHFLEKSITTSFALSMIHMVACIELFFVMSGLFLYLKFDQNGLITKQSSLKECFKVYGRMMASRYLRYMPSILLLILFSSSILLYLGNSPLWRHLVEPNVVMCQNKWWSNVFMVSNLKFNNYCWLHTWYIAADFQLYAIFLFILVLSAKYPQWKKYLYTLIGVLGILLPSAISYIKKLDSVVTMSFENYRHMYVKNAETGEHMYISSYANLNAFFVGIICGELYVKYLKHDKYKRLVGDFLKPLPPLGCICIAFIWYLGSKLILQEASIWTALFAILYKNVVVYIVVAIVILRKMCMGSGKLMYC